MELALKSLEALSCKSVGLGPRGKGPDYFWNLGLRSGDLYCGEEAGSCLISDLPKDLRALIRSMAGGLWRPTFHPSHGWFTIVSYSKAWSLNPDGASQRCYQKPETRGTWGSKGHIVIASTVCFVFGFNAYEGRLLAWSMCRGPGFPDCVIFFSWWLSSVLLTFSFRVCV